MHRINKGSEPRFFADWKADFRVREGREPVYDDLKGTAEYGMLKRHLLKEQGYICCYCEKAIGRGSTWTDCNIEHFMPRHPDRRFLNTAECAVCEAAQLDYNNLFVSCMGEESDFLDHCNHKKDNWYEFKTCVSPASKEIEGLFGFRMGGKIFAEGGNKKAQAMLEHLNLDTYALQEQRKNAYVAVMESEFDDELIQDDSYIMDTIHYYGSMQEGYYTEFCSMITYCLEHYVL